MIKRILEGLVLLTACAALCAALWPTRTTIASEKGLAYNNTYTLDLATLGYKSVAVSTTYSTATFSAASFTDGTASTATITVSTSAWSTLAGYASTDTIKVNTNSALAAAAGTDLIRVDSNSIVALSGASLTINGYKIKMGKDWFFDARASSWTALSIASAANEVPGFWASAFGTTVTVTCSNIGTACNSYALTSSTPTALVVSGAKFTGGQNAATLTYNGNTYRAGAEWAVGAVSSNTAVNIKSLFSSLSGITASTPTTTTVLLSCASKGTACDAYALASSTPAALGVSNAHFYGGRFPAVLRIDGVALTEGVDWTASGSASDTAKSISDAITANSTLQTMIASTWTMVDVSSVGVVSSTSTGVGLSKNYGLWSSRVSALKPFAPSMRGGTNSKVLTSGGKLNITAHGYTTALPVRFGATSGTAPQDLVDQTTYYVIPIDTNDFRLASTSAKAQAGSYDIRLATQTTTGGGSFTLTPLSYSGTASWKWQVSNDNTNWSDLTATVTGVTVSSVTYSSPSATAATTSWDLGEVGYPYVRLNVIGPTQGGLKLTATATGRR